VQVITDADYERDCRPFASIGGHRDYRSRALARQQNRAVKAAGARS
jgi:hypothetical protein